MYEVTTYTKKGEEIDTGTVESMDAVESCARTLWKDSEDHGTPVGWAHVKAESGRVIRSYTRRP